MIWLRFNIINLIYRVVYSAFFGYALFMKKYIFWAKTYCSGLPGIPVSQHGAFVSSVGKQLVLGIFPTQWQYLLPCLSFLLAVHDVGKISPQFQAKCPAWLSQNDLRKEADNNSWGNLSVSHACLSQEILDYFWEQQGLFSESHSLWSAIVGAHHGKWAKARPSFYGGVAAPRLAPSPTINWLEEELNFVADQWKQQGCPQLPPATDADAYLYAAAGLITLADWIASDENHFSADPDSAPPTEEQITQKAQAVVADLGLGPFSVRSGLTFEDIFGNHPYPMQTAAWENITEPGVYVIEAPMGMGKTEAALMAAYRLMEQGKARGLYFGLPTQATSNRIYERVLQFVQRISPTAHKVQLIHGNAWLQDDRLAVPAQQQAVHADSAADPARWFCSSRRALLAPVGVGTADQAMLAALAVKHFALRRLALMGKVVILDEVHSYDHYSRTIIQKLCRELADLGATVIILSATLTASARTALLQTDCAVTSMDAEEDSLPYPCISGHAHNQDTVRLTPCAPPPSRTVNVDFLPHQNAVSMAVDIAACGGQVLWVCNTVASAQDAFKHLQEHVCTTNSSVAMGILHARLPFYLREERETEWMGHLGKHGARQRGCILVSTQIVEQSVDLDADALFTELAPTDMLLQRMGRLWRHTRQGRPVAEPFMHIIAEDYSVEELRRMGAVAIKNGLGGKAKVYDPFVLLRTLEVWGNLSSLVLPQDIRGLLHATYTEPDSLPEAWQQLYEEQFGKSLGMRHQAELNVDIWRLAGTDAEEYAPTRLSDCPEYSFVMYRGKKGAVITLLDGSTIRSDQGIFSQVTARKLHRNALKIPGYRLKKNPKNSSFLADYGLFHWIQSCDDGCLRIPELKDAESPQWDQELGIVWPKKRKQP